jgi:hypothetical protein
MIVTAILTLTLLIGAPDDLVQVFAPTQGVSITIAPRDGCVQVDAFWIQCWASAADDMPVQLRYTCPTKNAVLVIKQEADAYLLELACRWKVFAPLVHEERNIK